MMVISGEPVLWHVVHRLKRSKRIQKIIVATTDLPEDRKIVRWAQKENVPYFIGDEEDVLDRYYQTAVKYGVDVIVRVTSDCPLIDPGIVDSTIDFFLNNQLDFANNNDKKTYPLGMDVEVFSLEALKKAWMKAKKPFEREHVSPFIRNHPKEFKTGSVRYHRDVSYLRLTVDYEEDLKLVRIIYHRLYEKKKNFCLDDILKLFEREPELAKINEKCKLMHQKHIESSIHRQ